MSAAVGGERLSRQPARDDAETVDTIDFRPPRQLSAERLFATWHGLSRLESLDKMVQWQRAQRGVPRRGILLAIKCLDAKPVIAFGNF